MGAKLGAGREADVHAWGDDAVVKLYRPGFLGHRAEAVALAKLDGRGIAPRLVDTVEWDGRTGLVLERLGGSATAVAAAATAVAGTRHGPCAGGTHLVVHEVPAPGDLPELRQVLAAWRDHRTDPRDLR